jgi:hypothetical protein
MNTPAFTEGVKLLRRHAGPRRNWKEVRGDGWYELQFQFPSAFIEAQQNIVRDLVWSARGLSSSLELKAGNHSIRVCMRECKHCQKPYAEHVGADRKCVFTPTHFTE